MTKASPKTINIKNYTSQVPVKRSVQRIEDCLIKYGAKNIIKIIEGGKITGLAFVIDVNGVDYPFKLPARIDRIHRYFKDKSTTGKTSIQRSYEQAERTAWRLLQELIEIQMSLVYLEQVDMMEIFLPYMYDAERNETLFEKMKNNDFKLLENRMKSLDCRG